MYIIITFSIAKILFTNAEFFNITDENIDITYDVKTVE